MFSKPASCATVSDCGRYNTSCGEPRATIRPASIAMTFSPSAKHLLALMSDIKDRNPMLAIPGAQIVENLRLGHRVECGQRLVQQQHARPASPACAPAQPAAARRRKSLPDAAPPAQRFETLPAFLAQRDSRSASSIASSPYCTFCATVMCGNSASVCIRYPTARRFGGTYRRRRTNRTTRSSHRDPSRSPASAIPQCNPAA